MVQDNYPAGVTDADIDRRFGDPTVPRGATCGECRYCKPVTDDRGRHICHVCAWCPMQPDHDWESGLELRYAGHPACPEWEAA